MHCLGLDIGGANIKLADARGYVRSYPFPLWRRCHELPRRLRLLISSAPDVQLIAVTMTGELADCFATKTEGVHQILDAVQQAAAGREVLVYLTDGSLVRSEQARTTAKLAAASNWHVLARFAAQLLPAESSGLLLDIGSTTCDVVPLDGRQVVAGGMTDSERLVAGELVYTGVQRSPICALVDQVRYRGQDCPVTQELFATTQDAYLMLGDLPEEPDNISTADGRPATKEAACKRLSRMISAWDDAFAEADALEISHAVMAAQLRLITVAAKRVAARRGGHLNVVVLSGEGEFLGRRVLEQLGWPVEVISLADRLDSASSRCATALALATLVTTQAIAIKAIQSSAEPDRR